MKIELNIEGSYDVILLELNSDKELTNKAKKDVLTSLQDGALIPSLSTGVVYDGNLEVCRFKLDPQNIYLFEFEES